MKIGIFGGAFDPPHKGHEKALLAFLSEAELDLCYVIPSGDPPHKTIAGENSFHRLEMAKCAFSPLSEKVLVSPMEVESETVSYSYLTVQRILALHPGAELFLFVGTDQFLVFETWKEAAYLMSQVTLCVMARYGEKGSLEEKKASLEKEFGAHALLLREKAYIISSTAVREELKKVGFSDSLSPSVNAYIAEQGLYASAVNDRRQRVLDFVKAALSHERFSHTLAVEREVSRLCDLLFCEEKEELRLAALLHDATKEWSVKEQEAYLSQRSALSEEDLKSPAVLHGFSAAFLAAEKGFLPQDKTSPIRFHTTGKKNMTLGEKILFFADYTEETRKHAVCLRMRRYFYENLPDGEEARKAHLDACVLKVMEDTITHLKEKNLPIHPLTLEGERDLKERKCNDSH